MQTISDPYGSCKIFEGNIWLVNKGLQRIYNKTKGKHDKNSFTWTSLTEDEANVEGRSNSNDEKSTENHHVPSSGGTISAESSMKTKVSFIILSSTKLSANVASVSEILIAKISN